MTLSCPFFLTVKNMPLGTRADSPGALLRHPSFPRLWGVWLMANVCDWLGLRPALFALTATGIAPCVLLGRRYRI
mgnify:CR=1 FL=1